MLPRIISREIIKRCSPTPHHLKTYKLSLLDQLAPDIYASIVLFYSPSKVAHNSNRLLKNSLSKTLTHYYPFAGRVRDNLSIDCDNSGAVFVEARTSCNMSEVLKNPEMDILEQLLPFNPNKKLTSLDPILAVQLNYFDCSGMAIAINVRHVVADGSAVTNFVKNWANVASGNSSGAIMDAVVDCTSIFPPNDKISSYTTSFNEWQRSIECVTKRFTFDGTEMAILRKEIMSDESDQEYRPSRFEAACALIWAALIDINRSESNDSTFAASIPVNLRHRMNPPLPQDCIGNLFHLGTFTVESKGVEYKRIARKINDFTKMVNDEFVRKLYVGGVFENVFAEAVEETLKNGSNLKLFAFTGLIGMPYYEIDFGWGKPTWFSTVMRLNNIVVLLNTPDGKGMEAWVGLPNNDMLKFEQHPAILRYASFIPNSGSGI